LIAFCSLAWPVMAKPNKDEIREAKREESSVSKGGKTSPGEAESRILAKLRERLEVADDAEWAVISERILKVDEARRSFWAPGASGRGGAPITEKSKRPAKTGSSAHPEQDALRSALVDNLPDAEIKARLARAHESQRQNELRLAKAQADLRSVLTIRQEGMAVMMGLLPP
jgi:hypothetical protein